MGAFILFPVLIFSIFITAIMGLTDYIHVAIMVHGAAQAAVTAASENATSPTNNGIFQQSKTISHGNAYGFGNGNGNAYGHSSSVQPVFLDSAAVNATVSQMLTGKPYITSFSCTNTTTQVTCVVKFSVQVPIVGKVNSQTTVVASNTQS